MVHEYPQKLTPTNPVVINRLPSPPPRSNTLDIPIQSTRLSRLTEGRTALPAANLVENQRLRVGPGIVRQKPQRAVSVAVVALQGRDAAAAAVPSVLAASIQVVSHEEFRLRGEGMQGKIMEGKGRGGEEGIRERYRGGEGMGGTWFCIGGGNGRSMMGP